MSGGTLADLTWPMAQYYSLLSPATYPPLSQPSPLVVSPLSLSLFPSSRFASVSWFFADNGGCSRTPNVSAVAPQDNLLQIVDVFPSTDKESSSLYLSVSEFQVLQALAQAALQQKTSNALNDALTSTSPNENPPPRTNYSNTIAVLNCVYPSISAPIYSETITSNRLLILLLLFRQSYLFLASIFLMPF